MAVFETNRTTGDMGTGLGRMMRSAVAAVLAWNDARVTRKALSRLSDRELDDIGLNRGDIERIRA
ncbi:DUF1127 domain-containing protein [Roseovarius aestuariivivens]|uniref:DUF1127 domain-containing protein n=1 Tax=Roseovarius aestuariivivens TaxID=1888910 RepID=UPI00108191E8|nr:DUF1127 domain-containing protein [Roseovarius aestuariivivens]